jgi:hypothetical protein
MNNRPLLAAGQPKLRAVQPAALFLRLIPESPRRNARQLEKFAQQAIFGR